MEVIGFNLTLVQGPQDQTEILITEMQNEQISFGFGFWREGGVSQKLWDPNFLQVCLIQLLYKQICH